jgi:hypothetical protein
MTESLAAGASGNARDLKSVLRILEDAPPIDREYLAPRSEFEDPATGLTLVRLVSGTLGGVPVHLAV